MQSVQTGIGSVGNIEKFLDNYDLSRILLVTGRKSFDRSGTKAALSASLRDYKVTHFDDFDINPKLNDAKKGAELAIKNDIELVVCAGGGSVIDMAKLIKALYANISKSDFLVKGLSDIIDPSIPIIAIPTTAGSGSESTHFAVVYIGKEKFSVADNCLLPNNIILDGQLTLSATKYQKACNVLDAMSQAIESAWAVGATVQSQRLSYLSLKRCMDRFQEYVNVDNSLTAAQSMIEAANLAGQAINISKTTAAHAWSYGISMNHGVPHGHSVWMTLPRIFELHSSDSALQINHPRGHLYLKETMNTLREIMGIAASDNTAQYFSELLSSIGVYADIKNDLCISKPERERLSRAVNQQRMANNPVTFTKEHIKYIFEI